MRHFLIFALTLFSAVLFGVSSRINLIQSGDTEKRIFIPMGKMDQSLLADFLSTVIRNSSVHTIQIVVLPVTITPNPYAITTEERSSVLGLAEKERSKIERACAVIAPQGLGCKVSLLPILVRSDAENFDQSDGLLEDLTAILILDGDPIVAARVVAGTPLERALEQAYRDGVMISGTGAGAAILCQKILTVEPSKADLFKSLQFDAIRTQNDVRGLEFGLSDALIVPDFILQGKMGYLLNGISRPDSPAVGIGIESFSGVQIAGEEQLITGVIGKSVVTILDAETYHASESVKYVEPDHVISLRNVLIQILSPGDFSYNLFKRTSSLAKPPNRIERSFQRLMLPPDAGSLIISASLEGDLFVNPILNRMINMSGGQDARIVAVFPGFDGSQGAQDQVRDFLEAIPSSGEAITLPLGQEALPDLPTGITGVILVGNDQSLIRVAQLQPIKEVWSHGIPLMTVNAGSAVIGGHFFADRPNSNEGGIRQDTGTGSFRAEEPRILPGLGLLEILVEPQMLSGDRWGRLFSLAYNNPKIVAFGLSENTAIELTASGARVLGENAVFALDLRTAGLDFGSNQMIVVANGILDVYAPHDQILPDIADVKIIPVRLATPEMPVLTLSPLPSATATVVPSPTPTLSTGTPTRVLQVNSTKSPRISPTPMDIPPSTDPRLLHSMIMFGIVTVLVVLLGVWMNRGRINMR
jgi:cyanophycinase